MIIKAITVNATEECRGVDEVHYIDGLSRISTSQGSRSKPTGFDGAGQHWALGDHSCVMTNGGDDEETSLAYPDDGIDRHTFHALAWHEATQKFVSITVYSASNVWLMHDNGNNIDRLL